MHFQIRHEHVLEEVRDVFGHDIVPEHDEFTWTLENVKGEVVCAGPHWFASEREARSQIARAKKTMAGAGRFKVKSPEASVPLQNPPSGER